MLQEKRHDGRAPDYDDWDLNGDIIVYYPVLDIALELSSMGIRVDEDSLARQAQQLADCEERANLPFQKSLLNKELPYTVGGGIGQSRICMYYLRKAHIGEVLVLLSGLKKYFNVQENMAFSYCNLCHNRYLL